MKQNILAAEYRYYFSFTNFFGKAFCDAAGSVGM